MIYKKESVVKSFCALISFALLISGCSVPGGSSRASSERGLGHSFTTASPFNSRVSDPQAIASVNSLYVAPVDFSEQADASGVPGFDLDQQLGSIVKGELGMKVISPDNFSGSRKSHDAVLAEARKTSADAVLFTRVDRFIERSGSAVGGEGAEVGLTMTIVRMRDGKEVWRGDYSFHDKAISENLLQLGNRSSGNGAGWRSGRDSLVNGMLLGVRDFNERRLALFRKR